MVVETGSVIFFSDGTTGKLPLLHHDLPPTLKQVPPNTLNRPHTYKTVEEGELLRRVLVE